MALSKVLSACIAMLCALTASPSWAQSVEDLADVIERCERSVIRIEVEGKKGESLGSGFIVRSNGVFVTNVHVLAGATKATATFADGKQVKIKGTYYWDETRDVCVGRIEGSGYVPIDVVEKLPRKGETVTALGAPRGLSFTATNGIVSALREGKSISPKYNGKWVQIDAALSPGNSGGPLINRTGNVVAMSTLASRGDSQNLNFGISSEDILDAIGQSKRKDLVGLKGGISELEVEGGVEGGDLIARAPIPAAAINKYVEDCREDYKSLNKALRLRSSAIRKKVSLVKKGDFPIPGGSGRGDVAIMTNRKTKGEKYFFRNERVKERELRRYQRQYDLLAEAKEKIGKEATDESLFHLMQHSGGYLDTRDEGSIGFMDSGQVMHAFNDHDTVVRFDDQDYLMWLPSTSGLSRGSDVPAGPVYVAGTQTVRVPGDGSMSVTVLLAVSESELKKAVFGNSNGRSKKSAEEGIAIKGELMRKWTSGKHTLMARVTRLTDESVTLKKANGKTSTIARSKLSESDQKYLDSLE